MNCFLGTELHSESTSTPSLDVRGIFSELFWEKATVAYLMPQKRKKEENESLQGERDRTKFINFRFERWQVVGFRKGRRRQDVP